MLLSVIYTCPCGVNIGAGVKSMHIHVYIEWMYVHVYVCYSAEPLHYGHHWTLWMFTSIQGLVTTMCPVLPSETAIKIKISTSFDSSHEACLI